MDKPDDDTPDPDAFRPGDLPRKADLDNQPPRRAEMNHIIDQLTRIEGQLESFGIVLTEVCETVDLVKLRLENLADKVDRWNS